MSRQGILFTSVVSDMHIARKQVNKTLRPEDFLWPWVPGCILTSAGLFWCGWSADQGAHFLVPIAGLLIFSFGVMMVVQSTATYLVKAFPVHNASVLAARNILGCLFGALLPLGGLNLIVDLGLGWGNSVLAIIMLVLTPIPVLLVYMAEGMRHRANAA